MVKYSSAPYLTRLAISPKLFLSLWLWVLGIYNSLTVKPLQAQQLDLTPNLERDLSVPVSLPQDIKPPSITPFLEPKLPFTPSQLPELRQSPTPTPEAQDIPTVIPDNVPRDMVVNRFEIVGSTVFTPEELAEVTNPFLNRPLALSELYEVRSVITKLYNDQGYITSGAFIPPQEIQDGVVKIEIVEGELEAINITGTQRLKPDYVRSRIAIATQKPLNSNRLLEALQLLQLNPLIANLSAELSAGTRPGQNILDVQVSEADSFSIQIFADNTRVPSVGTFQRGVQLTEGNVLGLGDEVNLVYKNTDGSNEVDADYTLPFNARNGSFKLEFRGIFSEVVEPPFDELDITSDYQQYKLTVRQPVIQTPEQDLALSLTFDHQRSKTFLLDIPFPLSPGSDERGQTRLSTLRFAQEWTLRGAQQVIAARSQFSFGFEAFDGTINDEFPDSRYFAWRGQGQWVRLLAPDTVLVARTDLQFADRPLAPVEQFGVGGLYTVRGYRQDALLTDNGVFASVELRLPIFREPKQEMVLQIVPFIDFGVGWNNSGNNQRFRRFNPDPNTLTSVGLGLRYQLSDRLSARFDWGIPLVELESRDRTLQEQGLYFSVIYTAF